jgi:putative endonuclease
MHPPSRAPVPRSPRARDPAALARRSLGRLGEQLACEHLERLGFAILARNVRTRAGEIDVIAHDGSTLAFVEVKALRARSGASPGCQARPLHWLHRRQLARLRSLALAWLCDRGRARPAAATVRFDAIGVVVDRHGALLALDHVEGAA